MSNVPVPITVARGDGIGPEIMDATLRILEAGGARLDIEEIEIGEKVYDQRSPAGIDPESWDSLRRTKVFLKAPITTPQGGGFKSLNVTVRKTLGMYANVRPCVAYAPFIETKHPEHGRGDRPGERRGPLRRHRAPADRRGRAVPEADQPAGLREDLPLRLRVRTRLRPQEGHVLHEGQHHEDDRRSVPQGVRRGRRRVPRHRERALDHRHRRRQDGRHARGLRRHRHAEPLRRHPLRRGRPDRRVGGAGRRAPTSATDGVDVRGHPRFCSPSCRSEPGQPVGPVPRRRADAGAHRPGRRRRDRSTTRGSRPSRTASTPTTSTTRA